MKQWRLKKDIIHPDYTIKAGVIGKEERGEVFFQDERGYGDYWEEGDLAVLADWFELVDHEAESQEEEECEYEYENYRKELEGGQVYPDCPLRECATCQVELNKAEYQRQNSARGETAPWAEEGVDSVKPSEWILKKMDKMMAGGVSYDTAGLLSILDFLDEHFKN